MNSSNNFTIKDDESIAGSTFSDMSKAVSSSDELRDQLYRMKLQVLNERLMGTNNQNKTFTEMVPYQHPIQPVTNNFSNSNADLEKQLSDTKKQFKKLKNKLKEQEMERRLTGMSLSSHSKPQESHSTSDRFGQYVEMMMLQQTQTQNMILNQMMIHNLPKPSYYSQPVQVPIPTPQYIPEPIYPTKPMYLPQPVQIPTEQPLNFPQFKTDRHKINSERAVVNANKQQANPFPGNPNQQFMRRLGLAALFCSILKSNYQEESFSLRDSFLFEIKIKEIITSCHNIYLNKDNQIYALFQPVVNSNALDFRVVLTQSGTKDEMTIIDKELNYFLQNLVSSICEIMPTTGTLGTESRSILSEFVQTNQIYPAKYFFRVEMDLFQLDANNCLHSVGVVEAQVLIIGIFFIRSLVMTVMLKPVEYGITPTLTNIGRENLRIASSIIVYIYRCLLADFLVQKSPNKINKKTFVLHEIEELKPALVTDTELEPLIKSIKKTIDYCKNVIAKWAFSYVAKLRPL